MIDENGDDVLLRKSLSIDGVFDIETEKWDKLVAVGLYTEKRGYRAWTWRNEDDAVDEILHEKGTIWAHNGGKYDILWLLEKAKRRRMKVEATAAGERLIAVKIGDGSLVLRDSAALLPMSLKKAGGISKRGKTTTGLPCICLSSAHCGGYCSISRKMDQRLLEKLLKYLKEDCLTTYWTLATLQQFAEEHDLDLTGTIGSSAWRTARRWGKIPKAEWKSKDFIFVRSAYYGGRVQVFCPKADQGYRYDINSAYPAALVSYRLPTGPRTKKFGREALSAFRCGEEGVFRARVHVPYMFIPPLPVRTKHRIAYPVGWIEGTWVGPELRYAEGLGCKIDHIDKAITWKDSEPALKSFCERIWGLRRSQQILEGSEDKIEKASASAFSLWLKLYANSLTGKTAQNPEFDNVFINPGPEFQTHCPANYLCSDRHPAKFCCMHECTGKCGRPRCLNLETQTYLKSGWRIPDCAYPQWAGYLTAYTRIWLHKQLVSGSGSVYCDTDSCFATSEREDNLGDELGQWKVEGAFYLFEALAPKTYSYIDHYLEFHAKSKGIPESTRNFEDLRAGRKIYLNRGVKTFKAAAKTGVLFQKKDAFRQLRPGSDWFGDRILRSDGLTYPVSMKRLEEECV